MVAESLLGTGVERTTGSERYVLDTHLKCLFPWCLLLFLGLVLHYVSTSFQAASSGRQGHQPASIDQAEQKKKLGNDAVKAKNFKEAIALYGEAIDMAGDRTPATYFSNRAVAWAALGDWQHARDDAEQAMQRPSGITAKTLFHKVQAELKLEDSNSAKRTMALAARCGLANEVEQQLKARSLCVPEASKTQQDD